MHRPGEKCVGNMDWISHHIAKNSQTLFAKTPNVNDRSNKSIQLAQSAKILTSASSNLQKRKYAISSQKTDEVFWDDLAYLKWKVLSERQNKLFCYNPLLKKNLYNPMCSGTAHMKHHIRFFRQFLRPSFVSTPTRFDTDILRRCCFHNAKSSSHPSSNNIRVYETCNADGWEVAAYSRLMKKSEHTLLSLLPAVIVLGC